MMFIDVILFLIIIFILFILRLVVMFFVLIVNFIVRTRVFASSSSSVARFVFVRMFRSLCFGDGVFSLCMYGCFSNVVIVFRFFF